VLGADEVRNLSIWATEGLLPALTVLLDLDAETAVARRAKTGSAPDRLEREKVEFFERVRACYLVLAEAEPTRFLVIDATESIEGIQARIRERVSQLLTVA